MFPKERRRERRFPIQQPAFVRLQGAAGEVESATENISTHGVLLRSEVLIPVGSKIDVILRFPDALPIQGEGEVLRLEKQHGGKAFLVAVRAGQGWAVLGVLAVSHGSVPTVFSHRAMSHTHSRLSCCCLSVVRFTQRVSSNQRLPFTTARVAPPWRKNSARRTSSTARLACCRTWNLS